MQAHASPAGAPLTLDEAVNEIAELRPLGAIAQQILGITASDRFSAHELAKVIASDQALTSKMLRLSNSAYYGFPREITTVRDAIVLLGFREVRSATLASCVIDAVPGGSQLDYGRFWHFSVTVGMLAELLARAERLHHDEAFTAGVIHNIGRLALDQHYPHLLRLALEHAHEHNVTVAEAERATIGFTDAELGGRLALHWNFPEPLVEAVASHAMNVYSLPDGGSLAAQVIRARLFAASYGLSDSAERTVQRSPPADWSRPPLSVALDRAGGLDGLLTRVAAFLDTAVA